MAVRAVILAAGQGTRMKSDKAKVLHEVAGKPMVRWVIEAARAVDPVDITVVVGHRADDVIAALPDDVESCLQAEQLGTGHAVQTAVEQLGDITDDTILVLSGDTPLLTGDTLIELVTMARRTGAAAALLTSDVDDPDAYGRILRDGWDRVVGIVEHRDATPMQLTIHEINAGIYVFDGALLGDGLAHMGTDNAQGEYYLTDLIGYFAGRDLSLSGLKTEEEEVAGVNSQRELADTNVKMRTRLAVDWMERGVWIQDPSQVFLSADVEIGAGARLYQGVHLEAGTTVGKGATVGPDVFASGSSIGEGARVWYSVLRDAEVGAEAEVGPYVSLRPGTVMGPRTKAGTFVEMKNTTVAEGAKVPHLAYLGDADVGEQANVGAGTITCNYDGVDKHRTEIGARAFVGSDTMLVAPVRIGDDAVTGAGSTITRDVSDGALAVERSSQREIAGYAARLDERRRRKQEGS